MAPPNNSAKQDLNNQSVESAWLTDFCSGNQDDMSTIVGSPPKTNKTDKLRMLLDAVVTESLSSSPSQDEQDHDHDDDEYEDDDDHTNYDYSYVAAESFILSPKERHQQKEKRDLNNTNNNNNSKLLSLSPNSPCDDDDDDDDVLVWSDNVEEAYFEHMMRQEQNRRVLDQGKDAQDSLMGGGESTVISTAKNDGTTQCLVQYQPRSSSKQKHKNKQEDNNAECYTLATEEKSVTKSSQDQNGGNKKFPPTLRQPLPPLGLDRNISAIEVTNNKDGNASPKRNRRFSSTLKQKRSSSPPTRRRNWCMLTTVVLCTVLAAGLLILSLLLVLHVHPQEQEQQAEFVSSNNINIPSGNDHSFFPSSGMEGVSEKEKETETDPTSTLLATPATTTAPTNHTLTTTDPTKAPTSVITKSPSMQTKPNLRAPTTSPSRESPSAQPITVVAITRAPTTRAPTTDGPTMTITTTTPVPTGQPVVPLEVTTKVDTRLPTASPSNIVGYFVTNTPTPVPETSSYLITFAPTQTPVAPTQAPVAPPPTASPTKPLLDLCQGDCNTDGDCLGDLICYQRQRLDPAPFDCPYMDTSHRGDVCVVERRSAEVPGEEKKEETVTSSPTQRPTAAPAVRPTLRPTNRPTLRPEGPVSTISAPGVDGGVLDTIGSIYCIFFC